MAWISVDQTLIGGKLRSLYKEINCSQSEAAGILITLWLWGIDNVNENGLIESADRADIAKMLQLGLPSDLIPENVVDGLINTGWIDDIDGHLYLHDWKTRISDYNKSEREKEKRSARMKRYRTKNSERDVTSDVSCDVTSDVSCDVSGRELSATPEKKAGSSQKRKKGSQEEKYGKEFEEFWSIYPRKADKGQAFKKYMARLKNGYTQEELRQAAEAYRKQCEKQHTEQQYIKHAKTFLGESLPFTEYIPKKHDIQGKDAPSIPEIRSL